MGPYGSEDFKTLLLLNFWFFSKKLFLKVPCNNSHKTWFLGFWIFKFKLKRLKFNCVQSWKNEKLPISEKRLVVERKGVIFGTRGVLSNICIRYLWPLMFKVIWGSFGALAITVMILWCHSGASPKTVWLYYIWISRQMQIFCFIFCLFVCFFVCCCFCSVTGLVNKLSQDWFLGELSKTFLDRKGPWVQEPY